MKPKQKQEFDGRAAKSITNAIYLKLIVDIYIESFALLFIIKLGNHFMIFGRSWMKKLVVNIDMTNNCLTF